MSCSNPAYSTYTAAVCRWGRAHANSERSTHLSKATSGSTPGGTITERAHSGHTCARGWARLGSQHRTKHTGLDSSRKSVPRSHQHGILGGGAARAHAVLQAARAGGRLQSQARQEERLPSRQPGPSMAAQAHSNRPLSLPSPVDLAAGPTLEWQEVYLWGGTGQQRMLDAVGCRQPQ